MLCAAGRREELPQRLLRDMGRYRHKVFVNHLGWPLQSSDDIESDEFDGPDAVYVSSRDDRGQVNGVARLLPTTAPYLLERIFPSLWGGPDLPHNDEIWELSRFAAVDFASLSSHANQAPAVHAVSLFEHVIQIAKKYGARTLVTVSPIGMERLLRVNGFRVARAGAPIVHDGSPILALALKLDDARDAARA